jgi:hypothetical protein
MKIIGNNYIPQFPLLLFSPNLSSSLFSGCGILFCNVMPNGEADPRTAHRACPVGPGNSHSVEKGERGNAGEWN